MLLVICFGVIGGRTLGNASFWTDELHTLHAIQRPVKNLIYERAFKGHPPCFFLLEKATCYLLGEKEWQLRMLPFCFGVASLVVILGIADQVSLSSTSFLACGAIAFSPFLMILSQLARSYTLALTLQLILILLLLRDSATESRQHSWMRGLSILICSTGAVLVHSSAYLSLTAVVIACLLSGIGKSRLWIWVMFGLAIGLVFVAYFPRVLVDAPRHVAWAPPVGVMDAIRFPVMLLSGPLSSRVSTIISLVISVSLWVLILRGLLHRSAALRFLAWQVWSNWLGGLVLAGLGINTLLVERYYIVSAVCLWILVAEEVIELAQSDYWRKVVCAATVGLSLFGCVHYFRNPVVPNWREMADFIRARRAPDVSVVIAGSVNRYSFKHYFGDGVVERDDFMPASDQECWICGADNAIVERVARGFSKELYVHELHHFRKGCVVHITAKRD
jgi:hypothetical protein